MTLRANLAQAAFWHGVVCLNCGEFSDEGSKECIECASEEVADARALAGWLRLVEKEEEE